ncbi:MAG: Flp pilus assembly protein CpaB [Planctomycetaceae bacterium]
MRYTPAKVTLLMFAVIGGLIAAFVAKRLLATEEEPPVVRTRNIPTPIAELEPGTVVTEAHLGVAPIEESALESDMLLSNRSIVGRVVKVRIDPLNPIRAADLYPPGEFPPIDVAEGSRAVSISLREPVEMVDGLVSPGQFVDVHFTPANNTSDERFRGGFTMTLFKGVKVLAINRSIRQGGVDQAGSTVTFELTPQQANVILLAREKGTISLSYTSDQQRGDGGVAVASADRATLDEILGLAPLPEPEKPDYFNSEIYQGTSRNALRFRDGRLDDGTSNDDRPASGSTPPRRTPTPPTDAPDDSRPAEPPAEVPVPPRDVTAAR